MRRFVVATLLAAAWPALAAAQPPASGALPAAGAVHPEHVQAPQPGQPAPPTAAGPGAPPSPPRPLSLPGAKELPPAPVENVISFDPGQAELKWVERRWLLVAGDVFLKDFGPKEKDGREALRMVRELRLNQVGTVGTSRPVMEYWLCDGKAPQAPTSLRRLVALDPEHLRVEAAQGQWVLRNNAHSLLGFGPQEDEARQALAVVRRHGFTHAALVGQTAASMVVYFAQGDDTASGKTPRPAPIVSRTVPPGGRDQAAPSDAPPETAQPAGTAPRPAEDRLERVPFDYRQLQVRKEKQEWKLVAGSHVLANFGPGEQDARRALAALQQYRCTEQCQIGRPDASLSFFLAGGQAPRGGFYAADARFFDPSSLAVKQTDQGWGVFSGSEPLLPATAQKQEAEQALRVMQRYKFDRLERYGKGLTLLVRGR